MTTRHKWLMVLCALCASWWVYHNYLFSFFHQTPSREARPPTKLAANLKLDEHEGKGSLSPAAEEVIQHIKTLFNTGQYEGALKSAEAAQQDPNAREAHPWITAQMPILLSTLGWLHVRLGHCEQAMPFFSRAAALNQFADAHKGLGVCLREQRNWPQAAAHLTAYFRGGGRDEQALYIYTDVLESLLQFNDAVAALEEFKRQAPQGSINMELERRLQSMRHKSVESVQQRNEYSRHFFIGYRSDEHEGIVTQAFEVLESALEEYAEYPGYAVPPTPIEVVFYPTEEFRQVIPGGPEWAEGIFDGRLRIPVHPDFLRQSGHERLVTILRHELVHALNFLQAHQRTLPVWFEEGVAQHLACRGRACGGFDFGASPGQFLPASHFEKSFIELDTVAAGQAYRQSLYLVRMLVQRFGAESLKTMTQHVISHPPTDSDSLLRPLGITFAKLVEYAQQGWKARR